MDATLTPEELEAAVAAMLAERRCVRCAHFDPRASRCTIVYAPHAVAEPETSACELWRGQNSGMNV